MENNKKVIGIILIALILGLMSYTVSNNALNVANSINQTNITNGTNDHSKLTNLNWSVAGHIIDTDLNFTANTQRNIFIDPQPIVDGLHGTNLGFFANDGVGFGMGGNININSGNGGNDLGNGGGIGGSISLRSGDAGSNSYHTGGGLSFVGGTGDNNGVGGGVSMTGGVGGISGNGGSYNMFGGCAGLCNGLGSGNGGNINIGGGTGYNNSQFGGDIVNIGGDGINGANGGNVYIVPGQSNIATNGSVFITNPDFSNDINIINGSMGIRTLNTTAALQVGDAGDGTMAWANAWNIYSSSSYKTNITNITDNNTTMPRFVSYQQINDPTHSIYYGVIAEELPKPVQINTTSNVLKIIGYTNKTINNKTINIPIYQKTNITVTGINMNSLFAYTFNRLINVIKNQNQQISDLKNTTQSQQIILNKICSHNATLCS